MTCLDDKIVIFGGRDGENDETFNDILYFDFTSKMWFNPTKDCKF